MDAGEIVGARAGLFRGPPGEHVGILGSRRAGKSTLLRLAAGVESPDEGRIDFEGHDLARMSALQRDRLLRGRIGLLRERRLASARRANGSSISWRCRW